MGDTMASKQLHLRIITPRGVKVDQKADMVIMRCLDGDMGFLPGHAPLAAVLGDGILRIKNGKEEEKLALFGGFVEVKDDVVTILTSIAQRPHEIDRMRAEADREQMEELLKEKSEDLKIQSYQVLLRRALVRIEVSSDSITSGGADEK